MRSRDFVSGLVKEARGEPGGIHRATRREGVAEAAFSRGLFGREYLEAVLDGMGIQHSLGGSHGGRQVVHFRLLGRDLWATSREGPSGRGVIDFAVGPDHGGPEFVVRGAGLRLATNLVMHPLSVMPADNYGTGCSAWGAWRNTAATMFLAEVRTIGLAAPKYGYEKLGEGGPFFVRRTEIQIGERARFRVVRRDLVYRCSYLARDPFPGDRDPPENEYVLADPRFATAPAGASRYTTPSPARHAPTFCRDTDRSRLTQAPFSSYVRSAWSRESGAPAQTPRDLEWAIDRHSAAWDAGPRQTPEMFIGVLKAIGMDWFLRFRDGSFRCRFVREGIQPGLVFRDKGGAAEAGLVLHGISGAHGPLLWYLRPRDLYRDLRDILWPEDGPPNPRDWKRGLRQDPPEDDGVS